MESLNDVISLWSVQLKEHAEILFKLLDKDKVPNLKNEAFQQWKIWNDYLKVLSVPNVPNLPQLNSMIQSLIQLKSTILSVIDQGQEVGNIYPALLDHMIKEANFFRLKLEGNVSTDKEIEFWVKENLEHTGLTAHLLDPKEKDLVNKTLNVSEELEDLIDENLEDIIPVYNKANREAAKLNQALSKNEVKTVNNPMTLFMLQHEIREATYGQKRLQQLLKQ